MRMSGISDKLIYYIFQNKFTKRHQKLNQNPLHSLKEIFVDIEKQNIKRQRLSWKGKTSKSYFIIPIKQETDNLSSSLFNFKKLCLTRAILHLHSLSTLNSLRKSTLYCQKTWKRRNTSPSFICWSSKLTLKLDVQCWGVCFLTYLYSNKMGAPRGKLKAPFLFSYPGSCVLYFPRMYPICLIQLRIRTLAFFERTTNETSLPKQILVTSIERCIEHNWVELDVKGDKTCQLNLIKCIYERVRLTS